ncbi:MAG: ribonuclease HII [Candidatus ainarchaeum sp.]|nr:ribonuclease HII [Candidatus ainarchaeum sp.]
MIIAGIDEAGRGCVLGPMVLAICAIDEKKDGFFRDIGVKDSKLLSKQKREDLFSVIEQNCIEYKIIVVPAEELNVLMDGYSLNEIEAQKVVDLLKAIKSADKVILDSPDTIAEKYTKRVRSILKKEDNKKFDKLDILSEHKADYKYMSVACASILAKVTRDKLMNNLVGFELSGYSSDPKTIDYLKNYFLEHKKFPEFTRLKWKTVDNIVKDLYQKKISWFK